MHDGFVTIKVPSAAPGGKCGYVSVSRYQTAHAHRTPRAELMLWKSRGWTNRFVEEPELCPGCRDEDDDDNSPLGHCTHAPRCPTCERHRPTWVTGIQQSHIDACGLCQADVRQGIQVKCILRWFRHRVQDRSIALNTAQYAGHRLR